MASYITIAIILVSVSSGKAAMDDCPSRQNGALEHPATIKCDIKRNFSNVYWHHAKLGKMMLVAHYDVENNNGSQSDDEEYGITSNGSLQIKNVSSCHHGEVYKVVFHDGENNVFKKRIKFLVDGESSRERIHRIQRLHRKRRKRQKEERKRKRNERKKRLKAKRLRKTMKNERKSYQHHQSTTKPELANE